MSELRRRILVPGQGLPPKPLTMTGTGSSSAGVMQKKMKKDYSPVSWDKYFTAKNDVTVDSNSFRVYVKGDEGPVILFLHGGGFSALTWAILSVEICNLVKCRCLAVDLRGHGDTMTTDDSDLSADTLSRDVGSIVTAMFGDDIPPIVLIGHSMGGAIAVHVAYEKLIPSLIGLAVIDVVEGTALEALNSMQSFLRSRPATFNSLDQAIEWSVRAAQVRNLESAKVSIPGHLKKINNNSQTVEISNVNTIAEEEEEEVEKISVTNLKSSDNNPPQTSETQNEAYTWRIDLSKTDKFWEGWFSGLSNRFLSCEVQKMLLLAGVDRLDKDLTIGQMQGKFQMQVLPQCGHAVHEDVPEKVAQVIATFMHRHKFAQVTDNFQPTFRAY